jgi:hypothetical protein
MSVQRSRMRRCPPSDVSDAVPARRRKQPRRAILAPLMLAALVASAARADDALRVVSPPPPGEVDRLKLSPWYAKYVSADGFPVVGSEKVTDHAMLEAAWLIRHMLAHRPDCREALIKNKVRLAVMAYNEFTTEVPEHSGLQPAKYWNRRARGLGPTRARPAVSAAEENLLCLKGDPYAAENILIHEFGHAVQDMGMKTADPAFDRRIREAYEAAKEAGLWEGTYAMTNYHEYWGEGTQSWFDTNRRNDGQHNDIDTREKLKKYDPALAKLLEAVYGDGLWRYKRLKDRPQTDLQHLAGFDPAKAPRFVWPKELAKAATTRPSVGRRAASPPAESRDPTTRPASK